MRGVNKIGMVLVVDGLIQKLSQVIKKKLI